MIKSAISSTVNTRLVTTTTIVAKLAVCAVLIAGATCAQAATGDDASVTPRRTAVHRAATLATHNVAAKNSAKKLAKKQPAQANLAKLERDWKRLHSGSQHGALDRLVACREYGRCDGLKVHPTLGAALIRVSPERPSMGAAISAADRPRTATSGVYAKAKASARLRGKPAASAHIRAAAADDSDLGGTSPLYSGAASVNP